jgi:hypothetical protein
MPSVSKADEYGSLGYRIAEFALAARVLRRSGGITLQRVVAYLSLAICAASGVLFIMSLRKSN